MLQDDVDDLPVDAVSLPASLGEKSVTQLVPSTGAMMENLHQPVNRKRKNAKIRRKIKSNCFDC